jgi:hypothetical protein
MNAGNISKKFIYFKRWRICCLLFFVAGCTTNTASYNKLQLTAGDSANTKAIEQRAFVQISSVEKIIHAGDLITRSGNDFTSESLRQLNQHDKTYSHCGIASIENDSIFVYHALGGEFNPDQKIRRDPFNLFCEPFSNRGIGIFRFHLAPATIKNVVQTAKNFYLAGIMFDMKFDLQTNDRMYCAEYVYKSFLSGTKMDLSFNISHLKNFAFIGVDDLFMNPVCNELKRIVYK